MNRLWCAWVLTIAAFGSDPAYDLSGRFMPEGKASVSLFGVASPFTATAISEDGRFSFKRLLPGAYTVAIFMPGRGEARQTVEIGPGTADEHQRVALDLHFKDSDFVAGDALRRQHSISASQLSVPEKAMREYQDAQKDLAKRDIESAVKRLEHAVEIAPQFSAAWNNLGTIAYQTQKYLRAEECFRESLRADPAAYEPLVNLGGVLVNLHKLEEAWNYNAFAVLTRPNDALAQAQMGMVYFELGRMDLAEKHFREAVKIDPGHFSHPQLFLAEIHLRRGDRKATADDLDGFLRRHPDWPQGAKMREKIEEFRK